MKLIFKTLILIVFSFSFLSVKSQNCPLSEESCKYNNGWILTDSVPPHIKYQLLPYPKKGQGIIFRYLTIYDCSERFDEEMLEKVEWYVADTISSFNLTYDSINKDNIILYQYLNIGRGGYWPLYVTGNIKGELQGSQWNIEINVTARLQKGDLPPIERKIQVKKIFEKSIFIGKKKDKEKEERSPFYKEGKLYY